jgi:RNA 2',3'-cyclic 3'-phosphodiesterase
MSNQIRLFVAIELPVTVKQEIARVQADLKSAHCFEGKYVDPEQLHITMKFIGSVQADQLDVIIKALARISFVPCVAQLDRVGLFCTDGCIKIVYVNVVAPSLPALAADLDAQLLPWCQPEQRAFVSHVTLARVKHVEDRQRVYDVVNALKMKPIKFEINSFVLMQSVLGSDGPEYRMLATFC